MSSKSKQDVGNINDARYQPDVVAFAFISVWF